MRREGFQGWVILAALVFFCHTCWGEGEGGTNTAANTNTSGTALSDEMVRSYLQIQDQLHNVQVSLEKSRLDAESAATRTADSMNGRLQAIEQSLSTQRSRELETLQNTNRSMLIAAGIFAAIGCLTVLCMAYFQLRTVNRLAEISASLPRLLPAGPGLAALGNGDSGGVSVSRPVEESGARLLGSIERLERRILELEHSTSQSNAATLSEGNFPPSHGESRANSNGQGLEARLHSLFGKGQSLMNLDKATEALACFDAILQEQPDHVEALMKKAMALEKLGRLDEAVEICDQAIAADKTSTVAYLYKGGLFNRMERFKEALQCYEQALHTQEQRLG